MSTSTNIHANDGDKLSVEIKDWGTYISVTVNFGGHSITMYPKDHTVAIAAQVHEVLKALCNPEMSFPGNN
jgi:hypothetical protein